MWWKLFISMLLFFNAAAATDSAGPTLGADNDDSRLQELMPYYDSLSTHLDQIIELREDLRSSMANVEDKSVAVKSILILDSFISCCFNVMYIADIQRRLLGLTEGDDEAAQKYAYYVAYSHQVEIACLGLEFNLGELAKLRKTLHTLLPFAENQYLLLLCNEIKHIMDQILETVEGLAPRDCKEEEHSVPDTL